MDWFDWIFGITSTLILGACIFLLGFIVVDSLHFGESTKQEIGVTVIDKEYTPARTQMMPVSMGKTIGITTRITPADYDVICEYNGLKYGVDSEGLYNSVEIGDSIILTLVTWYRKDGSIRKQFLTE